MRHEQAQAAPEPTLEERRLAAFPAVAEFAADPNNQYASGADIKAATGLSYPDVLGLNYGSYKELEQDATSWKEREDQMAAGQADIDSRNKRAQGILDEMAEGRVRQEEARSRDQKTDERIAGISYREKLLNGGEQALKRQPELRARIHEKAVETAAAEGHSVDHLQPRHYEVVTNPAAEARTGELAKLLKQHDREVAAAQLKWATKSTGTKPKGIDHKAATKEPQEHKGLDREAADKVHNLAHFMNDDFNRREAREKSRTTSRRTKAAAFVGKVIGKTRRGTKHGLSAAKKGVSKASMVDLRDRAAAGASNTTARLREYYNDDEKGGSRKVLAGAAAGALIFGAAGVTLYLQTKGFHSGRNPQEAADSLANRASLSNTPHAPIPAAEAAAAAGHVAGHETSFSTVEIPKGALPWNVLHDAGVDDPMSALDKAAQKSGLPFSWHGAGEHRYIEVAGQTDTESVIRALGNSLDKLKK